MRSPATSREPLLVRAFVLAAVSHFLHCMAFNLYLHFPGYLHRLGASEAGIGLITGAMAGTAILARPLMGRAMDRRGRRGVILIGGVLHAVVCGLYATVTVLGPWVVALRMVHGVAEAMLFAALFALAADLVPASRRIEGIALFGVSGMLPISLGGVLGDLILARGSYRDLFLVSFGFAVAGQALALPLRDAAPPGGGASRGLLAAVFQRDLLPIWMLGTVFAMALAAHTTFFKTYVNATGVGSVGMFFTAYSFAAVVLRLGFGAVPDRLGPKRLLFPALASAALGLCLVAWVRTTVGVVVAGVFCGLGHGYTFPILLGLVVTRARPAERGSALALFTALFDAGMLFGAPALGAEIRHWGYGAMWVTAAALVLVAGVAFAVWDGLLAAPGGS